MSNLGGNIIPPDMTNVSNFQNPVGDQSGNWQQGMANMLGATTGQAPQMGSAPQYSGAQLGATKTAGGANIGPTATFGGSQLNADQYNQAYAQQQGLANMLGAQAQGKGPSVAEAVAKQQSEQNVANQMAMLGSSRGSSNPALAQRAAADQTAAAQQAAAQQAVLGRSQEAQQAANQLGGVLGNMGQQAQSFAAANAQLQQQAQLESMGAINAQNLAQAQMMQQNQQFNTAAINAANQQQAAMYQQAGLANQQAQMQQMAANLQAALQQGQINAQQYDAYMQLLQQQNMAQYQGQMALEAQKNASRWNEANINLGQAAQQNQMLGNVIGAVGNAAGGLMTMFSDERVKTNIKSADKEINQLLTNLTKILF